MFHLRNRGRLPDPAGLTGIIGVVIALSGVGIGASVAPKANVLSLLGVVLFVCGFIIAAIGVGMRFHGMISQVRRILFRR